MMRDIKANADVVVQSPAAPLTRGIRTATMSALLLSASLVLTAGVAHAEDDRELTFDQKIMKSLVEGIGGTNMDNRGIEYRERSPLVVPPKLDLPPPETDTQAMAPNWPSDPDIARARAEAKADRDAKPTNPNEWNRTLTPAEMAPKRSRRATVADRKLAPGEHGTSPMMAPGELGYTGGIFKGMFGGGNKSETTTFVAEPTRGALTQPPPGYQTPSPNFAYGTGPREVMQNSANINPMTGKY